MKKGAAKSKRTTTDAEVDNIQQLMNYAGAKQLFIGTTLNMSWRLALTVLIPTIAGVQLDRRFDSAPSLTLTGFFLAVAGAFLVVASSVKEVNELQQSKDRNNKESKLE
jgi:F0F1-type ATP synthase assembly protein I